MVNCSENQKDDKENTVENGQRKTRKKMRKNNIKFNKWVTKRKKRELRRTQEEIT